MVTKLHWAAFYKPKLELFTPDHILQVEDAETNPPYRDISIDPPTGTWWHVVNYAMNVIFELKSISVKIFLFAELYLKLGSILKLADCIPPLFHFDVVGYVITPIRRYFYQYIIDIEIPG